MGNINYHVHRNKKRLFYFEISVFLSKIIYDDNQLLFGKCTVQFVPDWFQI